MTRPVSVAPGAIALVGAWTAALMIAVLTGAAAVVILLAAGAVGLASAAISGRVALRRVTVDSVSSRDLAVVVGDDLTWRLRVHSPTPVFGELLIDGDVVASGVMSAGDVEWHGSSPRRGVHDSVEVRWSSAGLAGLVRWRRRAVLAMPDLAVAPVVGTEAASVERAVDQARTTTGSASVPLPGRDEFDGVRPWRDGDEVNSVHWPSSRRAGELVMRQRLRESDERWVVVARARTGAADVEAARVRRSLEDGMASGARVAVSLDGASPEEIRSRDDVLQWCARFDPTPAVPPAGPSWWRRSLGDVFGEPAPVLAARARWIVAAATVPPLLLLLEPLGYGTAEVAVVLLAIAASAAISLRTGRWSRLVRRVSGLVAAGCVAATLIDGSQITSVAAALRFLMPQALVTLVVLQGFECIDRRAARVSLACAALVTAYSAGVRVDARLGQWLLIAGIGLVWALAEVTRPDRIHSAGTQPDRVGVGRSTASRRVAGRAAGLVGAALATLAILAVVPIPRGPTQLTLPSWLEQRRPTGDDGALASPDGSPLLGGSTGLGGGGTVGSTTRATAGSYAGFSPTMDTSARGSLGDEVVLRVRAPSPDFWRGQTYSTFDGRTWSVADETGVRTDGPDHAVVPAAGDVFGTDDQFVQTFYAEVDLPNLVFAATSARRVLLDAPLWQRADGALRAGVVLPAGSAYTVVSDRSRPTAALLRDEGIVTGGRFAVEYLQLPDSTTARVRELARQLATGTTSTYDAVTAIEAWLADHVTYDLDAPVPADGADAVDDFLFGSRRGFCEQIASATAVMLRSLGVPARVATGYVPSDRDEVAGVWISRASDAHAWVEVHFPDFGWVAFDPTASVSLSGEADDATIGGDLAKALGGWFADHVASILAVVVGGALALGVARSLRRWIQRRRRGRWGVLQDRFIAAAVRRGADDSSSNSELAAVFDEPQADIVARALDASAFAASWIDDDEQFERAVAVVHSLETSH